ncbi:P-loop containing nucleoside triphosphate hydrolase protein [Mycotypha africana]|uniref:P-loop containing nucleoside triphosphate hydrolase protein n=1 Tax=Mycotypha africana TaxID=64632 RepID=UPI002301407E|nr:P-loop containing nucleoside triphosphate hydrolase protein [Mycotypha africana]KAI8975029.1 P-loop containing nucleoside triphosphate hydrolase protein [Mycotypha africana]
MFTKTTLPPHATASEVALFSAPNLANNRKRNNLSLKEIQSDNISKLAEKHFKSKFDSNVVESIYQNELEATNFNTSKILLLEFYRYLEEYLWPFYSEKSSTNHVISICLIVNEKARQNIPRWDAFANDPERFSAFFKRVTHMILEMNDNSSRFVLKQLLTFMVYCFESFENDMVRAECLKLVTIGIWEYLAYGEERRTELFQQYPALRKLWNSNNKKIANADEAGKLQLQFEKSWLSNLLKKYVELIYKIPANGEVSEEIIQLCERYLELFIGLEAQLPTRRFFNMLVEDHQIIVLTEMAPFMQRDDSRQFELLKKLLSSLAFYAKFEINDQTGVALTELEMTEAHCQQLLQLQRIAFRFFSEELKALSLSNLGSIETREDLLWHLTPLSESTLSQLCDRLFLRHTPVFEVDGINFKDYMVNLLIHKYQKRISQVQQINQQPLYPDEKTLFDKHLVQTQLYSGERPLALPKLNLQFLTLYDYLWRNFTLFRLESSYEIRQDIEDVVKRLAPRLVYSERTKTEFAGWARMAVPIEDFNIVDIGEANLGEDSPSTVRADVGFDIGQFSSTIRNEWDGLRKHDVLFLLAIEAKENSSEALKDDEEFKEHYGIKYIRGCEVIDIVGSDGRPVEEFKLSNPADKMERFKGTRRTLRVELDSNQFKIDMDNVNHKHSENVYQTFNILVRRKSRENNFKSVLETIRDLMNSEVVVPDWLHRVLLGYGDPASAHYTKIHNREHSISFHDTFKDWHHFKSCFLDNNANRQYDLVSGAQEPLAPPYRITLSDDMMDVDNKEQPTTNKKSKKAKKPAATSTIEHFEVATDFVPNRGPYLEDQIKQNTTVRFTPAQSEAIYAGMNHGLTLVVGPPGTGKTDVAVQTMANLYRSHPDQHTLIVTHSNQALNQIFEKLLTLDVDPRHCVRLGHGEEEMKTEMSFNKYGRVAAALERRVELLKEVDRLAQSMHILGEHGSTCETAHYFYNAHVSSQWQMLVNNIEGFNTVEQIRDNFPFAEFFANAPQPVFTTNMTVDEAREIANGCFRHLQKLFDELDDIRPFELLRSGNDRANYLLTKECKIVAMTCTHAAMKRRELVDLNFKYDNIIIEEAAQILEIETFIPLLLQEPDKDENQRPNSRLKRVMLIGDHHQLPPVVRNTAFQQYGNMEQSMFTRFVRLGVPILQLDQQGRARPSIAKLFNWRYDNLQDLEKVKTQEAYQMANPGFQFDFQMIHVDKYQNQGETEPVPYFYQNLGEAEYIVAVYQYMRLIGYPAESISILTTYNGQKALIQDVLERRCGWNPYFGNPAVIETVDRYQGQQNDYVLLSLVRTKTVGYIRDVRRLIVAMSRARFGIYVFCNKQLFQNCHELEPVFKQFNQRPDTLHLVKNESYPVTKKSGRKLDDKVPTEISMDIKNVEDLGQLVYKLSQEQFGTMRQVELQSAKQMEEESTM